MERVRRFTARFSAFFLATERTALIGLLESGLKSECVGMSCAKPNCGHLVWFFLDCLRSFIAFGFVLVCSWFHGLP